MGGGVMRSRRWDESRRRTGGFLGRFSKLPRKPPPRAEERRVSSSKAGVAEGWGIAHTCTRVLWKRWKYP